VQLLESTTCEHLQTRHDTSGWEDTVKAWFVREQSLLSLSSTELGCVDWCAHAVQPGRMHTPSPVRTLFVVYVSSLCTPSCGGRGSLGELAPGGGQCATYNKCSAQMGSNIVGTLFLESWPGLNGLQAMEHEKEIACEHTLCFLPVEGQNSEASRNWQQSVHWWWVSPISYCNTLAYQFWWLWMLFLFLFLTGIHAAARWGGSHSSGMSTAMLLADALGKCYESFAFCQDRYARQKTQGKKHPLVGPANHMQRRHTPHHHPSQQDLPRYHIQHYVLPAPVLPAQHYVLPSQLQAWQSRICKLGCP